MRIRAFAAIGVAVGLCMNASAIAEQVWKPPAEIAPKADAAAPAAPAAAPVSKEEKAKGCHAQADAKGLKGKARKHFHADCMKS